MQPKNITSDMWEPITTSGNYTAYTPVENKFRAEPEKSTKAQAKSKPQENGSVQARKKPQKAAASPKDKPQQPQQKKSAERPISSGKEPDAKTKKTKRKQAKKPASKKILTSKSIIKLRLLFAQKKREKANKSFLRLVKSGKTTDEARAIVTKRKRLKRKLNTFLSVLSVFFFGVVFVLSFTYFEGAPVREIVITGDEVYSDAQILDAAQLSQGVNMLTVREKDVNDNVIKTLPFVSAIGVDYKLPDILELNIISTTERFIIKNANSYICVDKTGKVVSEKKKKLSEGQFLVRGMENQDYTLGEIFTPTENNIKKFTLISELATAAENNEFLTYGVINLENMNDITFTYKSRLRVYLGDGSNMASKLSQAEDVIKKNNAQEKTGYINVKYDIGAYFMQGSMEA